MHKVSVSTISNQYITAAYGAYVLTHFCEFC